MDKYEKYYVPAESKWPIVGAISLGFIAFGAGTLVQEIAKDQIKYGSYILAIGICAIIWMMYGWFKNIIDESMSGLYSKQMDRSFKQGMLWFIFSEVMFFVGFLAYYFILDSSLFLG